MPKITFSVSNKLFRKMRKFPEIKWTILFRQTIKNYLDNLENPDTISSRELRMRTEQKGLSFDDLPMEKVIESYNGSMD